jgi:hypothetical protein
LEKTTRENPSLRCPVIPHRQPWMTEPSLDIRLSRDFVMALGRSNNVITF